MNGKKAGTKQNATHLSRKYTDCINCKHSQLSIMDNVQIAALNRNNYVQIMRRRGLKRSNFSIFLMLATNGSEGLLSESMSTLKDVLVTISIL